MFKVINKDTRTTSTASCSKVFIVKFEQVIAGWEAIIMTIIVSPKNFRRK